MPPWSLPELEAALPLFPSVSAGRLRNLYSKWGGTVRWTLARADSPRNESYLEANIECSSIDALQRAMASSDAAAGVRSKACFGSAANASA